MELLEKQQSLENMCKDRRHAKMEEGREKLAAKGEVAGAAACGSQTSEMEAERLPAEEKQRKKER